MSRSNQNSPRLGSIPKSFKNLQNSSQKMKLKENLLKIIENPEDTAVSSIKKTHAWNYW